MWERFDILRLAEAWMVPEAAIGNWRGHPGMHVLSSRHNLRTGHLLHALQGFLSLCRVQVASRPLTRHLNKIFVQNVNARFLFTIIRICVLYVRCLIQYWII